MTGNALDGGTGNNWKSGEAVEGASCVLHDTTAHVEQQPGLVLGVDADHPRHGIQKGVEVVQVVAAHGFRQFLGDGDVQKGPPGVLFQGRVGVPRETQRAVLASRRMGAAKQFERMGLGMGGHDQSSLRLALPKRLM